MNYKIRIPVNTPIWRVQFRVLHIHVLQFHVLRFQSTRQEKYGIYCDIILV